MIQYDCHGRTSWIDINHKYRTVFEISKYDNTMLKTWPICEKQSIFEASYLTNALSKDDNQN